MRIIKLSEERMDEALKLADKVFRPNGGSMKKEYPLLFSKENAQNILCVEENGEIVSIFGLLFREIQFFSARIKVALVGSVCTDEKYRGRGYSTRLMNEAGKVSLEKGASLMMISGGNSIYRNFGAVDAGIYFVHPVYGATTVKYRKATLEDLDFIAYLHSTKPVRFVRKREIFKKMLEASRADNMPAEIFVSNSAYVVVTKGVVFRDKQDRYHCVEHGGCQTKVASLIRAVSRKMNPMVIHTTSSDCVLNEFFHSSESQRRPFLGTLKILDKSLFLKQLSPYLEERTIEGIEKINDLSKLTRYIFGTSENEGETLKEPVPLPDYGMDYV